MSASLHRITRDLPVALTLGGAVVAMGQRSRSGPITLRLLSSRPDMVTGGDALLALSGQPTTPMTIMVKGKPVATKCEAGADGSLIGLFTDPPLGKTAIGLGAAAPTLAVTNYPITGPVFSLKGT
jgi:hypothetical protein